MRDQVSLNVVQIRCICLLQQEKDTDTFPDSRPTSRQSWANLIKFVGATSACYLGCSLLTGNVRVSLHYTQVASTGLRKWTISLANIVKQQP